MTADAALFLDFDGTLAPIVPRPEDAVMRQAAREAVATLAERLSGAVAIVSGRGVDDLESRVAPLRLALAGGHGVELRRRDGAVISRAPAPEALEAIVARLARLPEIDRGIFIERKSHGVAVHYRNAPSAASACATAVAEAAAGAPDWRIIAGDMVVEIAPADANKGRAVARLSALAPFAGRRPFAVGDDVTDEDMFAVVNEAGGVSVKIGLGETRAAYRLASVDDVADWLTRQADGVIGT